MADQTRLVVGLVQLLKAEPTLLDLALDGDPGALIDQRTKDEIHTCLRCPSQARVAFLADCGEHGQRWLDLCPPCESWFRCGMADLDKAEQIQRWREELR